MKIFADVRDFGAAGDGMADDTSAIQQALESGKNIIRIPAGNYRITQTLLVDSFTTIEADADARIYSCGDTPKKEGDFLLSNRDTVNGNCNIEISGGIWDGNHQGRYNTKNPDLFAPDAWSGGMFNFFNIRNLVLNNMRVENSVTFFFRFGKINNFTIQNISFGGTPSGFNQDGFHFSGFVSNGLVENIHASGEETTDDMLALNADDCITRLENRGLLRGPIENITFRNIHAENCYTLIRMLSITAPIRNIRFENLCAGCRLYAINMDAARYCFTPLFEPEDFPDGVGDISNIIIDGMTVWKSGRQPDPLICNESHSENISVKNFHRAMEKDLHPETPCCVTRNTFPGAASFRDELFNNK